MLNQVLQYLKRGASIMPVGKDKIPLINWKEYQTKYPTEEEVKKWWTQFPEANIGVITGKISNLIVVDVEKGGDMTRFPETDTVQTGGGGWHLYYSYTPFENKTRIFPLTDIRGDGGYVVAPPSIHSSGKIYKVIKQVGRKPFPKELFEGNVKEKGNWNFEILKGVGSGSRNDSASKVIGKILTLFPIKEFDEAWNFTKAWNDKNLPPLPEWELRNVFKSIVKRELVKNPDKEIFKKLENDTPRITLTDVVEMASKEVLNTKPEDIVEFGYPELDNQMTGIFRGELVVIGGETGTGKTTFATNIIYKTSKNRKCYIFALEDRLVYYGQKLLYFKIGALRKEDNKSFYPWNAFIRNEIKSSEYYEYHNKAKEGLKNDNIEFYCADEVMTIEKMEAVLEKKVSEGVELFLIDHLHVFDLMRGDSSKADYIEKVMVSLKTLQNKTGARILLVVHYKKLNGLKPTLDSFKDSISIVQNANYVINLWRDRDSKDTPEFPNETFFYIPKARNPNGEATLTAVFDKTSNDYIFSSPTFGTPQENAINSEMDF